MKRTSFIVTAAAIAAAGIPSASIAAPQSHAALPNTPISSPLGNGFLTEAPGPIPGTQKASSSGAVTAAASCWSWSSQSTSFTTYLGSSWTLLNARSGPSQTCPVTGTWGSGQAMKVTSKTSEGSKIAYSPSRCQNFTSAVSSVWYKTSKGWVWSGGTTKPVWNTWC